LQRLRRAEYPPNVSNPSGVVLGNLVAIIACPLLTKTEDLGAWLLHISQRRGRQASSPRSIGKLQPVQDTVSLVRGAKTGEFGAPEAVPVETPFHVVESWQHF
jgi:hypothetical protein